jgi:hypothetical protein
MQINTIMNNTHKYFNFKQKLTDSPMLVTQDEINKMTIDPNKEHYKSIFRYNDKHTSLYKTGDKPSIKGSNFHDVVTNTLVWDFDSADPENAKNDVVTLALRLHNDFKVSTENMEVYFSGNKGFHLALTLDRDITPEQFKNITTSIAKGLNTYDQSVTDPARVLRLPLTKHPKTGLYKTALDISDVEDHTIDEIKELAKLPHPPSPNIKPVKLPEQLFAVKEKKEKVKADPNIKFDARNVPKGWKVYKWALAEGFFEEGERQNALMVVAATSRALNYSKEKAYFFCKDACQKRALRTGQDDYDTDEIWNNIISSVYSDTWEGGAYSPQSNPWLKAYCERMGFDVQKEDDLDKVYQMHDIEAEFIDYVKNIDDNTILTGITELDRDLPLTIGMNLGIIGAASSGKTALALKILENTSNAGVVSVFASLDMRRNRLYEKLLYRLSGLTRTELYKRIQEDRAEDIFQKVRDEYKNVFFYDRSCPSVDDIRRYINNIESNTGKKVKLVMVDYFERIGADRSDETAASKEVAGKLQDLVNDLNVCLITLVQPNKFSLAGGPDTPILNYTAIKGSSYLYQAFRSIISIWRPFFTPELKDKDKYMEMAILKNDLGELNTFQFDWEGKRGEIRSISEEGKEELKKWLDEKNKKKQSTDQSEW